MAGAYAQWRMSSSLSHLRGSNSASTNTEVGKSLALPAPSFPWVTTPGLPITVTDDGYTSIATSSSGNIGRGSASAASGAATVYPAVGFPRSEAVDMADIGADILASLVAA